MKWTDEIPVLWELAFWQGEVVQNKHTTSLTYSLLEGDEHSEKRKRSTQWRCVVVSCLFNQAPNCLSPANRPAQALTTKGSASGPLHMLFCVMLLLHMPSLLLPSVSSLLRCHLLWEDLLALYIQSPTPSTLYSLPSLCFSSWYFTPLDLICIGLFTCCLSPCTRTEAPRGQGFCTNFPLFYRHHSVFSCFQVLSCSCCWG